MNSGFTRYLKHFLRKVLSKSKPVIASNNISIFSCPEGFKIFYKEVELTKNVGLNFVWQEGSVFKDSSGLDKFKVITWEMNKLIIEKTNPEYSNLKLTISLSLEDTDCLVEAALTSETCFQNTKVILMFSNWYKNWIAGIHEGSFPQNKIWSEIGLPAKDYNTIGLKNNPVNFSEDIFIPVIFAFDKGLHKIENTDLNTNARILSALYNDMNSKELFLHGKISFFSEQSKYEQWYSQQRNDFIKTLMTV